MKLSRNRVRQGWTGMQAAPILVFFGCIGYVQSAHAGQWTQIGTPFPEGNGPGTVALLTDGRVLCSGPEASHNWYTLTPDRSGNYANGSWRQVGNTMLGRMFAPSYIIKDGRFVICGGEYVDPVDPQPYGDRSGCEIFDPKTNLWSSAASEMPNSDMIADTPTAELANGDILMLSYPRSGTNYAAYVFDPYGVNAWTSAGFYNPSLSNSEGVTLLLRDGSVLSGDVGFERYQPLTNSWRLAARPPFSLTSNPDPTGQGEMGPALMLYDGRALVLGGNSRNAIYNPDVDQWTSIADSPTGPNPLTPYNHSDTPASVEPNGRVLTVVTDQADGQGTSVFYEYDSSTNTWSSVTAPDTFGAGNRTRMLNLPPGNQVTGQVLVLGTPSQKVWLYASSGVPNPSWAPTVQSISGPARGEYTLVGSQLNGLTTGADLGDDAKMATNYPIVSLVSATHDVYYARAYNFDQMAPRASTTGSCTFALPFFMPYDRYSVHVSANGVDTSSVMYINASGSMNWWIPVASVLTG